MYVSELYQRSSNVNSQEALETLLTASKADTIEGMVPANASGDVLLRALENSPQCEQAKLYAMCFFNNEGLSDLQNVQKRFAGWMFEVIASAYIRNKYNSHQQIGPEATDRYFHALYPGAKIITEHFKDSLTVSTPDEMLLTEKNGKTSISYLTEYTLCGKKQIPKNKMYEMNRHRQNYPELFSEAKILLVVPQGRKIKKSKHLKEMQKKGEIVLEEVPFSLKQFDDFKRKQMESILLQ